MSLGSALQIAQNSLLNVTRQTSVVSRNVTESGNEDYTRRSGILDSSDLGSRIVVQRSNVNTQLRDSHLSALSSARAQTVLSNGLDQLNTSVNGIDGSQSMLNLITGLENSLQTWSAAPSDDLLANATIQDAKDLANALNRATGKIQSFRSEMDVQISAEVSELNSLLAEFHSVNSEIVNGTHGGQDVNDQLDRRDALLRDINKIVPVNTVYRPNNDLMLITTGGATLFETVPRNVTFVPVLNYDANTPGNSIRIDGVPVLQGQGPVSNAGGSLASLVQLRDDVSQKVQGQLDEVARGLVTAFSESDPSGGLPNAVGLFTYPGAPGLPSPGTLQSGLAGTISINAAFDSAQGGDPNLLRDGGSNGAGYIHNTTGAASYSDHMISLVQRLSANTTYDTQTGVGGDMSLNGYAAQSLGWIEGQRSAATEATLSKEALSVRLSEKLSNQTGVNIDEEMALLLQLERSYEASARLISTVDEMLGTLLSIAR